MQMADELDGAPACKKPRTDLSLNDVDFSALNELPDSLLSPTHQSPVTTSPSIQSQHSYISGLLTSNDNVAIIKNSNNTFTINSQLPSSQTNNIQPTQRSPGNHSITLQNVQRQPQQQLSNTMGAPPSQPSALASQTSPSIQQQQRSIPGDVDRRRLITQQLIMLLHAHKCTKRNKENPADTGSDVCTLPHCKTMKNALQHMAQCTEGRNCKEHHCVSSRQIIAHWKNCDRTDCPVCQPLKNASKKTQSQPAGNNTRLPATPSQTHTTLATMIQNGSTPPGGVAQKQQTLMSPVANQPQIISPIRGQPQILSPVANHQQLSPSIGQQQIVSPVSSQLLTSSAAQQLLMSPTQQMTVVRQQPVSTNLTSHSQQQSPVIKGQQVVTMPTRVVPNNPINVATHLASRPQSLNTFESPLVTGQLTPSPSPITTDLKGNYATTNLPNNQPNSVNSVQIHQSPQKFIQPGALQTTIGNGVAKEWHKTVSKEYREVNVQKVVRSIFPTNDTKVLQDPRMNNLIQYAKKVEAEVYVSANSQEEYYNLLAQKILKIRNELQEKRQARQKQQIEERSKALLTKSNDPMLQVKPDIVVKTEPSTSYNESGGMGVTTPVSPVITSPVINKNALATVNTVKMEKKEVETKEVVNNVKPAATSVKPVVTAPRKTWTPDELKSALLPTLQRLFRLEESIPFRLPVDPVALNIPDYFDIVKNPMDLSTMRKKLDSSSYNNPWQYVNDMWLMFENAWLYNKKTSRVYKWCTKLSEVFESEIDIVMSKLGYCCGRKYVFYPNVLVCYGKQQMSCTISQYQVYYAFDNRYTYCDKCFDEITSDIIELTDEVTGNPLVLRKDQFVKTKNDVLEPEPMTTCKDCGRKFHSICIQHMNEIWPEGYVCDGCLKVRQTKRKDNKYSARRLPTCKLSNFIETRVNNYLKHKSISSAGEVIVRILSITEKECEIKPLMKQRFPDMAQTLPYKSKAIFVFQHDQETDKDVCFFSMHVQEYDHNCPAPNTGRVYISYLDSVHFFKPREYRTAVYHEILIGYFDYVKHIGFSWGHIWACPPSEGDDYIFHSHPQEQKVPKPKRLQEWYKKMLDKALINGVVVDYKDIYKDAVEKNMSSACELPYFEGDFWTTILEECVKECEDEEEKRRNEEEAAGGDNDDAASDTGLDDSNGDELIPSGSTSDKHGKGNGKSKKQKGNKKSNLRKTVKKTSLAGKDLSSKVFQNMEKHRDMFFVICLRPNAYNTERLANHKINDPDPLISSVLMDARDSFLTMCRERHWEFSSVRRAAFSTMAFLYEVHTANGDGFVYTCNACKAQVETRYHCMTCDDFDLCTVCFDKTGHEHKMEKMGLDVLAGEQSNSQLSPAETRKLSIQRCIESLVHSSQCRDANCKLTVCEKMKRVVGHTKVCKRRANNGCPICKQLLALCCYHARVCKESMCPVPFCQNIRQKMRQQQANHRAQQQRLLDRRMSAMRVPANSTANRPAAISNVTRQLPTSQMQAKGPASHQQSTSTSYTMVRTPQPNTVQNQQSSAQNVRTVLSPNQSTVHNRQPVTGKTGVTVSHHAPQVRLPNQTQHLITQQVNVVRPQQQSTMPRAQGGIQIISPNGQQQQHHQQVVVTQRTLNANNIQSGSSNVIRVGNPNQPSNNHAIQRLLATLKAPHSPEQKKKVLEILKSHPALMQAYLRQKQQQATMMSNNQVAPPSNMNQVTNSQLIARLQQQTQPQAQVNFVNTNNSHLTVQGNTTPTESNADPQQRLSAQEELSRYVDSL